jgi:hypothetical protein
MDLRSARPGGCVGVLGVAERHTNASNFHVDTNLAFVDCGSVPPDVK